MSGRMVIDENTVVDVDTDYKGYDELVDLYNFVRSEMETKQRKSKKIMTLLEKIEKAIDSSN